MREPTRTFELIELLCQVLGEVGAVFRNDPHKIAPNRSHVASPGHKLLETKLGHFDVLGSLDEGVGYEQLLPDTTVLDIQGLSVRVLTLERLIAEKERASTRQARRRGAPRVDVTRSYADLRAEPLSVALRIPRAGVVTMTMGSAGGVALRCGSQTDSARGNAS